jgi:hypothetical protein
MTFRIVCSTLFAALLAVAAIAGETAPSASAQRFGELKKLIGDWYEAGKDGKPTDKLVSSIRVTSAGTAIEETLFPGGDHEMVTMYHLDGDDLMLTHYCALGNQPRMKAEPGSDAKRIVFKCVGATNLKSEDEQHMHQATLTIADGDHLQAEWASNKEGKECHRVVLNLVRKPN